MIKDIFNKKIRGGVKERMVFTIYLNQLFINNFKYITMVIIQS